MRIGTTHYRSIWMEEDPVEVKVIDQTRLPFEFAIRSLKRVEDALEAISRMVVRGAPLIGVTAAYGLYLAARHSHPEEWCQEVNRAAGNLVATRPTAVNLRYAVDRMLAEVNCAGSREGLIERLFHLATRMAEDEVQRSRSIGQHGLKLIEEIHRKTDRRVNILTHCNAGWLACVDYGTATAPVYLAHDKGIPVHVWVDETRPRNQGSRLTAYEMAGHDVPHTVIVDNAGGRLMQLGEVDLVLVGSDRTTRNGDVVNKIGTYLKALAAKAHDIPFYVALPSSSVDPGMMTGQETVIEERDDSEVVFMEGWHDQRSRVERVRILPEGSTVKNPGFDVTPASLVTGLITEKGIFPATEEGVRQILDAPS